MATSLSRYRDWDEGPLAAAVTAQSEAARLWRERASCPRRAYSPAIRKTPDASAGTFGITSRETPWASSIFWALLSAAREVRSTLSKLTSCSPRTETRPRRSRSSAALGAVSVLLVAVRAGDATGVGLG